MSLALLAALIAPVQPAETPRAFVERVYAGYGKADYSPFTVPERVFAAPLVEAMAEDSRLSYGEVGFLDGDPLCQCQDAEGLAAEVREVRQPTRRTATVAVRLRLTGYDARDVRLRLVRAASGWRIADIATPEAPSLLHDLERSNRRRH
jgi:Protein of unknown function (DUF3828)